MKADEILARPLRVLSQTQREHFFENGYLLLEKFVSDDWLKRLWEVTREFIEEGSSLTQSTAKLDLDPSHSA